MSMSLIRWLKAGSSLEGLSSTPRGYVMAEPLRFGRHVLGAPPEKPRVGFWRFIFGGWLNWRGALCGAEESQPARPRVRSTALPVQAQLTLRNVDVIRNDLSDSDLEVVESMERVSLGRAVHRELEAVK